MGRRKYNWLSVLFVWVRLAALAAFVFWLTVIVYWRDFRHLGDFHMTIYSDRISYDPNMPKRFGDFESKDDFWGGAALRQNLIFHAVQNAEPLKFENIAGVTYWRPWFSAAVMMYSTIVRIDTEGNRLERIEFNPQSKAVTLTDALHLAEDIRTWL
ncbi:MAG: hypothetical protein AAGL49_14350, partial [Pseudomonadota bacterium]